MLAIVGANAFSALVFVIATPLLSRVYDPDAFAIFGIAMSFIVIVGAILPFGADKLVLTEGTTEQFVPIMFRGFILAFLGTVIIMLCFLTVKEMASTVKLLSLGNIFLVLVGLLAISGLSLVVNWHLKFNSEKIIAASRLIQAIVTVCCQIVLSNYANGLLLGYVVGVSSGLVLLLASSQLWKHILLLDRRLYLSQFDINVGPENFFFGLRYAGIVILNNAGSILVPTFILYFYSATEAGFYYLATRIFNLPNSVLGRYVGDRFIADVSLTDENSSSFEDKFWRYTRLLAVTSVMCFIIVVAINENYWTIILGEQWDGIQFTIILVAFLQLIYFSCSTVRFELRRRLKIGLRLSLLRFVITCLVISTAFSLELSYAEFIVMFVSFAVILQFLKFRIFLMVYLKTEKAK